MIKATLFGCIFFSILLLNTFFISSQDNELLVNSGEAEYSSQGISLSGKVSVQHDIGVISANKLNIIPSKKNKFASLEMEDQVTLKIKDGGELNCEKALINYETLSGSFLGNKENPDVIFKNTAEQQENEPIPLIVKSNLVKTALIKKNNKTKVDYIIAEGNVRAFYNQDYLLFADHAIFQSNLDEDTTNGILTLTVLNSLDKACLIINQNKDAIKADRIILDSSNKTIRCLKPRGHIYLGSLENDQEKMEFSADDLMWDEKKQILTLTNHIKGKIPTIGTIITDELQLNCKEVERKRCVHSLLAPYGSTLTYIDPKTKSTHSLICQGFFEINHENKQLILKSPRDHEGKVLEDKQVYFDDLLGDVYADEISISYEKLENTLVPKKLLMVGNVKIQNCFDGHIQECGSVLQYALADNVEYDIKQNCMLLKSNSSERVLLYDKVNDIQMSAPSLKITRDHQSAKGAIQGMGDVRFTFIEKEFEQIRRHFQLKEGMK